MPAPIHTVEELALRIVNQEMKTEFSLYMQHTLDQLGLPAAPPPSSSARAGVAPFLGTGKTALGAVNWRIMNLCRQGT